MLVCSKCGYIISLDLCTSSIYELCLDPHPNTSLGSLLPIQAFNPRPSFIFNNDAETEVAESIFHLVPKRNLSSLIPAVCTHGTVRKYLHPMRHQTQPSSLSSIDVCFPRSMDSRDYLIWTSGQLFWRAGIYAKMRINSQAVLIFLPCQLCLVLDHPLPPNSGEHPPNHPATPPI